MKPTKKYDILRVSGKNKNMVEDIVILEYPFTIFIDGKETITLLCSPKSLKHLAIGFLHSEGFIKDYSMVDNVQIDKEKGEAYIRLGTTGATDEKPQVNKTIASSGGKGTIFYEMLDSLKPMTTNPPDISIHKIREFMRTFSGSSDLFYTTGGVHACAVCDKDGIIYFEEDIGRHNALDKVLGRALVENMDITDKMVLTSGRISSEMLAKVAKSGITTVISRSAPTSLAVHMARKLNMMLIGFVRGEKMNIYSSFSSLRF